MRLKSLNASNSKLFFCDLVTFNFKPFLTSFQIIITVGFHSAG